MASDCSSDGRGKESESRPATTTTMETRDDERETWLKPTGGSSTDRQQSPLFSLCLTRHFHLRVCGQQIGTCLFLSCTSVLFPHSFPPLESRVFPLFPAHFCAVLLLILPNSGPNGKIKHALTSVLSLLSTLFQPVMRHLHLKYVSHFHSSLCSSQAFILSNYAKDSSSNFFSPAFK